MLFGHAIVCAAVLWMMPGGWAIGSAHQVAYRLLPIIGLLALMLAIAGRPRGFDRFVLAALMAVWLGLAVAAPVFFGVSWQRLTPMSLLAAITIAAVLLFRLRGCDLRTKRWVLCAGLIGLAVSALGIIVLRSPAASTRPDDMATIANLETLERRNLRLDQAVSLDATNGSVTISSGRRYALLEPLLRFPQRSPDACWTIFSPRSHRVGGHLMLTGTARSEEGVSATYLESEAGRPRLEGRVDVIRDGNGYRLSSTSQLDGVIWSHLNTFSQITLAGHRSLQVRFSPMPDTIIDVMPAGYPFGAPARFAYVDSAGIFHVVEASSAEKGPFKTLAEGFLGDAPLTITFLDGSAPFLELTFEDWARQASREPSPSAGWNVPQNAIEFSRSGEDSRSPVTMFITLASTSVGRGWSSVGHASGGYQNRMRVVMPVQSSRK